MGGELTFLFKLMEEAYRNGVISGAQLLFISVFCWLVYSNDKRRSLDFNRGLNELKQANEQTIQAMKQHITSQEEHLSSAEQRYQQLRTEVQGLQKTLLDTHDRIWNEVLRHLNDHNKS